MEFFWNKNILILLFEQYSNFVLSDVNAVSAPRHISAINVVWCWLILLYEYILHNQQLTSSYILQLIKHFSYFCSFTILKLLQELKVAINFISFIPLIYFLLSTSPEQRRSSSTICKLFCPQCLYVIMTPTLSWYWSWVILGCCGCFIWYILNWRWEK